ncbi:MAG: hypothetical protein PHW63_09670 [Alphaproteobacteria bacterium]|nr:hypothetical protein [Alphaproteobacteria bacterium]
MAIIDDLWARIRAALKDQIDSALSAATRAETARTAAELAAGNATAAVNTEIEKLINGAPAAFDTLKEVADELAANETERAALTNAIAAKADIGFGDVVATHITGDFNTLDLSVAGQYRIRGGTGYVTNMPLTTAGLWWNVVQLTDADATGANTKLYLAHSTTSTAIYMRSKYGATWSTWIQINLANSTMTYAIGSAAEPTTTGYLMSAAVLKQIIGLFTTGSSTVVPSALGQSLASATDASAARVIIGAGTVESVNSKGGVVNLTASDVGAAPTTHGHVADDLTDATTIGKSVVTAATTAAARTAIGAGTSSLAIGTTSSTAKAGDYAPDVAGVAGLTTALSGKINWTSAYTTATPETIAYRDLAGNLDVAPATAGSHAVTKDQVDQAVAGKVTSATSGLTIWTGTQVQYDALPLATRNEATFMAVIV